MRTIAIIAGVVTLCVVLLWFYLQQPDTQTDSQELSSNSASVKTQLKQTKKVAVGGSLTQINRSFVEDNRPKRPYPDIDSGFFIDSDGDSVYRMLGGFGDWTLQNGFANLKEFGTEVPNEYVGLENPIGFSAIVANKFRNDSLIHALIDVDVGGYTSKLSDKLQALISLDRSILSESHQKKIIRVGYALIDHNEIHIRQKAAMILASCQIYSNSVTNAFVSMQDWQFYSMGSANKIYVPVLEEIVDDPSISMYKRLLAARATMRITENDSLLRSLIKDILTNIDTVNTEKTSIYFSAATFAEGLDIPEIVPSMVELVYCSLNGNYRMAMSVVRELARMAQRGVSDVEAELLMISLEHPDKDIRYTAKHYYRIE